MRFTKMHGTSNDYVYVNCFSESVPRDLADLARRVSHRRLGVGSDGLILIWPSDVADARMQMFNADGSEAEMCGNGIRCVAKLMVDHQICAKESLRIETRAGVLGLDLELKHGKVERVRVDMGRPILRPDRIPTTLAGDQVVERDLDVAGQTLRVTCVSMGNPHCVTFVDAATDAMVHGLGPLLENDRRFPARSNVEFVEVVSRTEVRQRTWERGSGETWACGTGASAVCVAGVLSGRTERRIVVHLLGGDLEVEWDAGTDHVFMTGPAVEVFSGDWPEEPGGTDS
ncbi:MAG: diaminopimelate epimerase [Planctomycetes bacterium]|nr:diaminopimelate epimerase [Planctomycetota bacterium]